MTLPKLLLPILWEQPLRGTMPSSLCHTSATTSTNSSFQHSLTTSVSCTTLHCTGVLLRSGLVLTKWPHSNRTRVGGPQRHSAIPTRGRSWFGTHIKREYFKGEISQICSMNIWWSVLCTASTDSPQCPRSFKGSEITIAFPRDVMQISVPL